MDSRTRLDYALFQLTPTRTRCDLVIFSGSKTEKLAYGLLQPFVSHLKFAKDEISKGGYSITLRPPTAGDSSWFTKATFERFVRFVSTPEILERFINLEKEILQIESSSRSNELEQSNVISRDGEQAADISSAKSPDSSKIQGEAVENNDVVLEENSRIRLQRILQTRKAMLLRSQAMAYARGRAAGFDMDNMDELIAFSDEFGASRLREACVEFKEFFKKKQSDVPWMEELSAMEAFSSSELLFPATSGIILTNNLSYSSNGVHLSANDGSKPEDVGSDGKKDDNVSTADQIPPPNKPQMWPNQFPPYMYHQMPPPPYQGYPFPIMQQPVPPYQGYHDPKRYKAKSSSSGKKERSPHEDYEDEDSEEDAQTESSDGEGNDSDEAVVKEKRKNHHKKKPSSTVVIRNINYITSKGKDGDEEEDSDISSSSDIDGDSLKKKVEGAVEALKKKNHKSKKHTTQKKKNAIAPLTEQGGNEDSNNRGDGGGGGGDDSIMVKSSWDAFQNILLRNEDSDSNNNNVERQTEYTAGDEQLSSFQDQVSGGGVGNGKIISVQRKVSDDSMIVVTERHGNGSNLNASSVDFESKSRMVLKRSEFADGDDHVLLLSGSSFDGSAHPSLDCGVIDSSSLTKTRRSREDDSSFVVVGGKSENGDYTRQNVFDGDSSSFVSSGRRTWKEAVLPPMDDSFMIQSLRENNNDEWKSSEINEFMLQENVMQEEEIIRPSMSYEPDDLCGILVRDADDVVDPNRLSWNDDFAIEVVEKSGKEMEEKESSDKIKNPKEMKPKVGGVNRPPLVKKTKPAEITSRVVKKPSPPPLTRTAVQKSKLEKEEEMRKRMEELVIERQKRIAERSVATGVTTPVKTKNRSQQQSKARGEVNRTSLQHRAAVKTHP